MDESAALTGTLAVLDRYLESDHGPTEGMDLAELDGFLTGIAVGPEAIPPNEWTPVIWGEEEPEFSSEEEMSSVFAALMDRYNAITMILDTDPSGLTPVYWEDDDGTLDPTGWVAGFMQSLQLRPDAWQPLLEDSEAQSLLLPFLLFGRDESFEQEFGEEFDEDAFLSEAPDLIPVCAISIHEFWRSRAADAAPARPN